MSVKKRKKLSPSKIILLFSPILVNNVLELVKLIFCISSAIIIALSRLTPLTYANGRGNFKERN